MKKLLSIVLSAALLLAVAACGAPAAIPNPPLVLGEKYLTDLDYEQALLQFDQAIVIEPKNPRGYLGKADALLHLDRQSDAVSALSDAAKQCKPRRAALNEVKAEVAKSFVDGYIGLATAYEKLGWREIALLLLQRVCEELPEESRLREALERLMSVVDITESMNNSNRETADTTQSASVLSVEFSDLLKADGRFKQSYEELAALLGCTEKADINNMRTNRDAGIDIQETAGSLIVVQIYKPSGTIFGIKCGDSISSVDSVMRQKGYSLYEQAQDSIDPSFISVQYANAALNSYLVFFANNNGQYIYGITIMCQK